MSVHRYNSWGRTRRPKEMSSNVPADRSATKTVTPVASATLSNPLAGTDDGTNGYVTENQKYLHIQIENNATSDTVELYVYNYAFGAWAKYYIPVGISLNGSGADTSITNDAYVEAKWTTIDGKFMVTIPIMGIDRVAFVHDGSLGGSCVVKAACSSF